MSEEIEILKEINELRKNPSAYTEKIIKNKVYFREGTNVWKGPDCKRAIKTEEGPAAYDEAIDYLNTKAVPVEELVPSIGMNKIAKDLLVEYQKDVNANIDLEPIIAKYGDFQGKFHRIVEFGGNTAENVVINLIVNDGDPNRSHREILLSDEIKRIGVAHGIHDSYFFCSVILICTKFDEIDQPTRPIEVGEKVFCSSCTLI